MVKCSACSNQATREVLIYTENKKNGNWIPRCDDCIIKGFKGKIRRIK